jgi:hypothetical protein
MLRAQWRRHPLKIAGPVAESPKSQAPAVHAQTFNLPHINLKMWMVQVEGPNL